MDTGLSVHLKASIIYTEIERQILFKDFLFLAKRTPFLLCSPLTIFVSAEQIVPPTRIHNCKR